MSNQLNNVSGELLRILRQLKGIKQCTAANLVGVKQQAISKIEKQKKISTEKFGVFTKALNVSAEDIERAKMFLPPPPLNKVYIPTVYQLSIRGISHSYSVHQLYISRTPAIDELYISRK